ncbi:MAG TPA: phage Gp37/Gp68 family protein [Planktothrix sp. UBA8407]|jgi:Bacteriophage protein gp37|nr:phage Gp37/Gp68 family protein [Planktothrix sp. UBA8407]
MATKIQWCDETINPIVGCSRVSPGCERCYAASAAKSARLQQFPQYQKVASWNGTVELVPNQLDRPYEWKKGKRIFIGSMTDLFHENTPFSWLEEIMAMIEETTQHTYQILTKRPERMIEFFDWYSRRCSDESIGDIKWRMPDNIWLGVSCENQAMADKRIPLLMQIPAKVRFLSCEPLLEPINLSKFLPIEWSEIAEDWIESWPGIGSYNANDYPSWVIVGGESGAGSRACHVDWLRDIASQCQSAKIPVFIKQLGNNAIATRTDHTGNYKLKIKDRKGSDILEWFEDLRIQQFPN